MKILPKSFIKIYNNPLDKMECTVSPAETPDNIKEGNVFFKEGNILLNTTPLLEDKRQVSFKTYQNNTIIIHNTYKFAVEINDIQFNQNDIIPSYTMDMFTQSNIKLKSKFCFVSVLVNTHAWMLDKFTLNSLYAFGEYKDIPYIILGFNLSPSIKNILSKYNCIIIDGYEKEHHFSAYNKILYWTLPRFIYADYFIFLDCDLLITNNIYELLKIADINKIICSTWNDISIKKYLLSKSQYDLQSIYKLTDEIYNYPKYINSGFAIIGREALLNIDSCSQKYKLQVEQTKNLYYIEEFLYNICIQYLNNLYEIPCNKWNYTIGNVDELIFKDNKIYIKDILPTIIHLIAGPKTLHYDKIKDKIFWKFSPNNIYIG